LALLKSLNEKIGIIRTERGVGDVFALRIEPL
jgi:hypothetical protein